MDHKQKGGNLPPRLELFSDAVFAIIITIMVLELRPPHGATLVDLYALLPTFASYLLSFLYLIIYWNNHHHLLHMLKRPTGAIMWANAHLLFWLSLVPFATAWIGESHGEMLPAALYGVVMFFSACAYFMLQNILVAEHGESSPFARALGKDVKGTISLACYLLAIGFAFVFPAVSYTLFAAVALMWLVPDRRIEKALLEEFGTRI